MVYYDPYAREAGGIGIGDINLTGGYDKSYWFAKGDEIVYRLKKKHFDDKIESIFGDCPSFYDSIKDDYHWKHLDEYVLKYSGEECE